MDPQTTDFSYDFGLMLNIYEPLIWYNGTSPTLTIPWLAQNYTISNNGTTANFTLRSGIKFADGEPLNSSAVYFSFNRLLMEDSSTPSTHGSQAAWYVQQLLNASLSSTLTGPQNYTAQWESEVLAENFVQITGPLTFTLHIMNPNAALQYILAGTWADIIAPNYVMQQDLAMWSKASAGYSLPYTSLSGNETTQFNQYFLDLVSTCNAGSTPAGCGATYLQTSLNGTLAGTGPYVIQSATGTGNFVFKANPSYWGGAYQYYAGQKISPQISTIDVNYVPSLTTREIDLKNAAGSGRALIADIPNDNLYDVANRQDWISNSTLVSTIPGVSIYGPFTSFDTLFDPFVTNVTNVQTGQFYTFQPFADLRFRLAFSDAVNMSEINVDSNNNLGQVAGNLMPPGFAPNGVYNTSIAPAYSYNLTAVQDLLLSAMENPITHFNFVNGTAVPSGLFNNTFGCSASELSTNGGTCAHPVPQTVTLVYDTGDTVAEAIMNQIAQAVNNVSSTYNMGLTVSLEPLPSGQMLDIAISDQLYMWSIGWHADYPWATALLGPVYAPGNAASTADGWNLTAFGDLYAQAVQATAVDNVTGLVQVSNLMNQLANQEVMYLWTFYPETIAVMTSNLHGFFYNVALPLQPGYYFAYFY